MTSSILGSDIKTGQRVELHQKYRIEGLTIIGLQRMGVLGVFGNLIIDDIKQGRGVCVLDPHGTLVDNVIARLPDAKTEERVILVDLTADSHFAGVNLFACANPTDAREVAKIRSLIIHVFEKLGITLDDRRMYDYLYNCISTLIVNPGYTLLEIPRLFTDATFRRLLLINVTNPSVHKFWDDYTHLPQQDQQKETREILRRLNDLSDFPLKYLIGQSQTTVSLQEALDQDKILLVKLDRQLINASMLLGAIIVALIVHAAPSRTSSKQFHLYADEVQNFVTEDFAILLEQAGKWRIGVSMAHQNRSQLELSDKQADANLKTRTLNVGSLVVFRVPTDAEVLAPQFKADPKPGKTEFKRIPERQVERIKVKRWEPPEAEEELKKTLSELERIDRYIQLVKGAEIAPNNLLYYCIHQAGMNVTTGYDFEDILSRITSLAQQDVPASDKRLLPFYAHVHPVHNGLYHDILYQNMQLILEKHSASFKTVYGSCRIQEVFPSEAVKATIRPQPDPYEKFFVFEDTSSYADSQMPTEKELVTYISNIVLSNSQKSVVVSFIAQELQMLMREFNYSFYVLKTLQSMCWNSRIIYQFVPDTDQIAIWEREIQRHGQKASTNSREYQEEMRREGERIKRYKYVALEREYYTFASNGVGFVPAYWRIVVYPGLWEWLKGELIKLKAFADKLHLLLELLEEERAVLSNKVAQLRLHEKEYEVVRDKTYTTPTGEQYTPYYRMADEKELKITHGFSKSYPYNRMEGKRFETPLTEGESTTISEERIPIHYEEAGNEEQRANAWNRIVEELVHLPRYTAWVKIADLNGTVVEHVIETRKPDRGLYGKPLQDRLDRILQQNIRDGYIRPLNDIEVEITQRQPQPQPQRAPQAPQAARKAASPCPSCGFSNPQGSKFCNQCGAKL